MTHRSIAFAVLSFVALLLGNAVATPASELSQDEDTLRERTLTWVRGWRTSPEEPFSLEAFQGIYARDDSFSSFDFGRPHDGFSDWSSAAAYYRQFMAVPKTWELKPGDDLRIHLRGNVGWSTVSLRGHGTLEDGTVIDLPEARVTLIFEKRDGEWLIVHEHGSSALPFPDATATQQMLNRTTR